MIMKYHKTFLPPPPSPRLPLETLSMNLCDVEYLLRMRSLPGSERDANWLFTRR